ncbi:MAG: 4Fe-4S binding protein [Bacteroidales bacterium]|nr:4Fe-4S binding protein [Bacteroidales bacterium]
MKQHPIYIEKNDCQDCYKCLRQCPVKAIKVENSNASIVNDLCIYCGHCLEVCPVGAKKMRSDIHDLRIAINNGQPVIACLAPTYLSDFSFVDSKVLITALQQLGFTMVSETALGAAVVASESMQWFEKQPDGIYISSCCPSVVDYVQKYYPNLNENLAPFQSPMQSHARMLKELYGSNYTIAFFGPCVAKKHEADQETGYTDYVLTFHELIRWLDEDLPGWQNFPITGDCSFKPYPAARANFFPVEGGMIATMKKNTQLTDQAFMSFSGIKNIREILQDIPRWNHKKLFLELLICEGGCIKGPGTYDKSSVAVKRNKILQNVNPGKDRIQKIPIERTTLKTAAVSNEPFSDAQITSELKAVGKFTPEDELNCGGCGYNSCRDFARAMLMGNAERTMCITYMRRLGQGKASALLKKMPSGVVIADDNLKVIDSNRKFAEMLDDETMNIFETTHSLEGADLKKLISFSKLFESVLHSGEEMAEHDIRENNRYLHVSVVTIQPYKIVCGVIQDMREPEVRRDIVLKNTRQVIKQNMDVVQKIAFLLGENASYTESMLKSIIESHDTTGEGINN